MYTCHKCMYLACSYIGTSHGFMCEVDIIGEFADIMVLLMPLAKNGMIPIKNLEDYVAWSLAIGFSNVTAVDMRNPELKHATVDEFKMSSSASCGLNGGSSSVKIPPLRLVLIFTRAHLAKKSRKKKMAF